MIKNVHDKQIVQTLTQWCLITDQQYGGCIGCDLHPREVPHHKGST